MGYWAALIGLLMIGVGQALGGVPAWPGENDPETLEYQADVARIKACEDARDMKALETLAEELHAKWSGRKARTHGNILADIAGTFSSNGSGEERRYDLARKYALLGLKRADELSLNKEADLLRHIGGGAYAGEHPLAGEELAKRRADDARLMLHCWRRVETTIDPDWDPGKDAPGPLRMPPELRAAGASPDRIRDPVARADYEAQLAKRNQWVARNNQQSGARKVQKRFSRDFEEWFVQVYSMPPYNQDEVLSLLNEYKVDRATQALIVQGIEAKMPRPRTRPSTVPADLPAEERLRLRRQEILRWGAEENARGK